MPKQFNPTHLSEDDSKFKELLLFICRRSEGDEPFGATKLNKLLFFADFMAYRKLGKSITGHRYQKLDNGPAPQALLPIRNQLEEEGAIALGERDYHGHVQKRIFARRDPDLAGFTPEEIDIVTGLIQEYWGRTATQLSDLSHEFRGWQLAEDGEDIPYEVALVEFERESETDLQISDEFLTELVRLDQECS